VTANNVANVNTEGYSRKLAQQEAVILDGRGAGARATDTARAADESLAARLREQQGRLGRSEVLGDVHGQIQARLFGAPGEVDRGIPNRIAALAAAAEGLAGGPDQPALAKAFVGAAQDLTGEIAVAGAEVQRLRGELDQRLARVVDEINAELRSLDELNRQMTRGAPSAELLDRRDALLESLAAKIEISVSREDGDAVAVYTRAGGQPLLEGTPRQLVYEPASLVAGGTSFAAVRLFHADDVDPVTGAPLAGAVGSVLVTGGVRAELTPEFAADATADASQLIASPFRAGRLQGLLEGRDLVLPALADQLGELAGLARHALNAAHNAAVSYPPPGRVVGTRTDTAGFAAAARSGTAYIAVVDQATGAVAATVAVDLAAAADAAALAGQIAGGLGGLGTAAVNADGALEITVGAGYGIALGEGDGMVTVTDAAGHARPHGFAHYFGLNDLVVADGAEPTALAVRADIAADAGRLSRSRLDVAAGPPPVGSLGGAGDNRSAQRLAAAFEAGVTAVARGALPAGSYRVGDYAAEIVATAAMAADRARGGEAGDRALADELGLRKAEVSGVNLDEELSRLVL
jgi:flagellar hook-associated protein 1 FlgK